jgi:hypothetical protein
MPREKPKAKRLPDFDVFVVEGDDDEGREQKGFWTKIGGLGPSGRGGLLDRARRFAPQWPFGSTQAQATRGRGRECH